MNEKGFILITSYMVIGFLSALSVTFLLTITAQLKRAEAGRKNLQSFYLAEAGVDYAIEQLRQSASASSEPTTALKDDQGNDMGTYTVSWQQIETTSRWTINSTGKIVNSDGVGLDARTVEMIVSRIDRDFYSDALYVDGNVMIHGNAHTVNGNIRYSGEFFGKDSGITGELIQDSSIPPLEEIFDITKLETISESQDNIYEEGDLSMSMNFWYGDQADQVPNIVVIEGNLTVSSSNPTVGGFIVIKGDTTLNGGAQVNGCIYTLGNLTMNGGGNAININGGVWTRSAVLNGNTTVMHNATYMDAIKKYGKKDVSFQVVSWEEK